MFQKLPCQTKWDYFFSESLSMHSSVLFYGMHKADILSEIPSFQALPLSLLVLDNSSNHLPTLPESRSHSPSDQCDLQLCALRYVDHDSFSASLLSADTVLLTLLLRSCFLLSYYISLFSICGTISLQDVAESEYQSKRRFITMNDLIIQYAMKTSDNLIKNNLQPILEMLAGGLNRQITEDEALLLTNAVKVSVYLGISQTMTTLCSSGILEYSEDALRRYLLTPQ
nr:MAG TPA: hypothetical protein [Caudoviricetes sp.]